MKWALAGSSGCMCGIAYTGFLTSVRDTRPAQRQVMYTMLEHKVLALFPYGQQQQHEQMLSYPLVMNKVTWGNG